MDLRFVMRSMLTATLIFVAAGASAQAQMTTAAVESAYAKNAFKAPTAWVAVPGPGATRL